MRRMQLSTPNIQTRAEGEGGGFMDLADGNFYTFYSSWT
jgi:hypothetical protein